MQVRPVVPRMTDLVAIPDDSTKLKWHASRPATITLWCIVLLYQVLCASIMGALGFAYLQISPSNKNTFIPYLYHQGYLNLSDYLFIRANYKVIGTTYAALCCCFLLPSIDMLLASARSHGLVYGGFFRLPQLICNVQGWCWKPSSRSPKNYILRLGCAALNSFLKMVKVIGIRGEYFAAWHALRETIEITLQIIQAYSASRTLSNRSANTVFAAIVLMNCSSDTLIHSIFHGNDIRVRLISVLVDLVLDFCWGTFVQVWLIIPFLQKYLGYTTEHIAFNGTIILELETRLALATSWWNFALTVLPFVGALWSLQSLKNVIPSASSSVRVLSVARISPILPASSRKFVTAMSLSYKRPLSSMFQIYRYLTMVLGFSVFAISCVACRYAFRNEPPIACTMQLYPWFTRKLSCVQAEIDCSVLNISGTTAEIAALMDTLDDEMTQAFVFMSCPELDIPSFSRFKQLERIGILDSVVNTWSEDASLSQKHCPSLQNLYVSTTEFRLIPYGLFAQGLSPTLEMLEFAAVNMSTFIDRIGTEWQHVREFFCSWCELTSVPMAISFMNSLTDLELPHNAIMSVPPLSIPSVPMLFLVLSDNPIRELPSGVWEFAKTAIWFNIENTQISEIPSWVLGIDNPRLEINGFNSTFCDGHDEDPYTREGVLFNTTQRVMVHCAPQ